MVKAYKKFFINYANFKDRSTRSDYWYAVFFNLLIGFIVGIIGRIIPDFALVLSLVYLLIIVVPGFAVVVRRLHDVNKSGWFYFIGVVPFVGFIILLIFLCMPSVDENNKYGKKV